ncbi:A-kinase anchor protein 13 [Mus musculus]|uniref:A-kinase anchor protein 13 n=1 Tax=Mus musculus TaxID=10090 RepID=AKP13_MOUSE|nr:A-kinase anchor protein 13 [Mus musculus]E9Q394.1 RecName: Full=A-kinase anchor protein 13; Short=AKAP-13; AltName: Full=AKAP-Lbc [Mus musculus]|eukprot:NP_083608.1 A-kinase anchor protein 13 [Mus musculus]
MKLSPQQAPLYGDCVVTVLLAEEDKVEDDAIFYLIFSGSTLYHCTSTRKVSSDTLETIAPGHDCCETVKVLLCASREGLPVFVVAEEDFHFVQDEAYDAAQFLATSAGNQQALNFTRFLDRSGPPSRDVNSLDEKVALAFRHLKLPAEWNVLGTDHTLHDGGPRETLMHFAVRLGLLRLTWFLLQKPGGRGALSIHNKEGATPVSLALERGYHELHQLLTEENAGEPDSWSSLSYEIPYGDCSVRHHRELDIYTLTSESESHREPHGDSCTGHISKLMNIQQQLMKTNLKQMDNLMPLMVTAQDSSCVPSVPETDGLFLPCVPEPSDHQHPPFEETKSTLCCQRSPGRMAESSCDLSSMVEEENVICSHKKNKDVGRKGEEAEPASAMDSGSASHQDSCLQSVPDCGVKGREGLPSCGNRNEVTGTNYSGVATCQQPLSSRSSVLQDAMVTEPDACQHSSGRELPDSSSTDVGAPEKAGELEHSLLTPDATTQNNKPQVGEGTKERLENSDSSTTETTAVQVLSEPMEKADITNHVFATSAVGVNTPAEASPALSSEEIPTEKPGMETQERGCEGGTTSDQSSPVLPAAAIENKVLGGQEPDTSIAGFCKTASPLDLTMPGPSSDGMPEQNSESHARPAQSLSGQALLCSTAEAGTPSAEATHQPSTVTSSGRLEECGSGKASLPESTMVQPSTQELCTTLCPEDPQADTVTSDTVKNTQKSVGVCHLCVSDAKNQGNGLKQDTPLTNVLEDVPRLPSVVSQTEKELAPDQVSPPASSFSLASSPESESVTKDDALSLVPSQKEKGTATPQLHRTTACRDGPDGRDLSDTDKVGDGATDPPPSSAVELRTSMGNTSPVGIGGEQEGSSPTATLEVLSDSLLHNVDKAALVSDFTLPEEGVSVVVPESSTALGQDGKDRAMSCSSVKEDVHSSEMSREDQRTPPSGQEIPGLCEKPMSALCAEEKAQQHTPSACLKTETKDIKEVAPQVSLLTEGGAAKSLVPPRTSLSADSKQKASSTEQSGSSLLPSGLPGASEALHCNQPSALDVVVENTQFQGETNACEVSRSAMEDVTVADASPATAEPRKKDASHCIKDIPISELLNQEKQMTPSLPEAFLDKGVTDLQEVITPEIEPLDCKRETLEGTDLNCATSNSKETPIEKPMQPLARDLPTETGLSVINNNVPQADMKQVAQASIPAEESNATTVSTQAADVPTRADSIEETATRIVEAVIRQVRASNALMAKVETQNPSLSSPETKQLENAYTESACAFLPGETPQIEKTHEDTTGQCGAETEEPEKIILPESAPGKQGKMPDTRTGDEVDLLSRISAASEEEAVGNGAATPKMKQGPGTQAINRESWCAIEPCPEAASLLASKQSSECRSFIDVGLGTECASKEGMLQRVSGSESDLFHSPSDEMDSIIFPKPEEEQLLCDTTGSSSSTDDTASLDRHSSHGSDVSLPQTSKLNRSRNHQSANGFFSPGVEAPESRESESEPAGSGEMEEEEMDSITEVPANCSFLRSSMRSLSPFRRHSWGPGKNAASDAEMNQRSSMRALGHVVRRPPIHRRSFSLEGLTGGGVGNKPSSSLEMSSANSSELRNPFGGEEQRNSLMSLSEEHLEPDQRQHHRMFDQQTCYRSKQQGFNYCTSAISSPLTKSISLMTISHPGLDSSRPFHSTSANLTESITEENCNFLPPSPSKKNFEEKSGTKVSRTFSYIRNKMSSSKKSKEKEKEKDKIKEKEKDSKEKEKDKKTLNGHTFSPIPIVGPISCSQCMKPFTNKDAYTCAGCGAFVHKGCRENLASCAKVKMKQPKGSLQAHDTSSLPTVIMRNKSSQPKERPRSAVLLADEATAAPMFTNRRSQQSVSLSKSVSIQNITGVGNDENMSNTWKFLSHSTDSLNKICKVNESTESLTDEGVGTDMNEGQLMGDFESDSKQLEAESWSRTVDSKFLKQQKKDVVKRQEVIYELMQTELHHIRTLKIMSDVYSRGMMTDLLFEQQMVEKLFPCLDELISIHSQFFQRILERKKESLVDKSEKNFLIKRIGDVLVSQFSGESAERLKKTYGKFCGQHNQSVNYFKDLYTKDKRFQAFVKKKMSSSVVRRLGIPECILLVTQRITKYPVLFQRILQCTKDNEVEQEDLTQSLSLVKDVIGAVDSKVASYEKKVRLGEIYTKTDSKSIMRMKSGQMFAKEDLRRKKLVRDGSVFLKSTTGRLKEVQAVLLTDILVFLQEKDQKYVFASLDHKSTVISLKKLIVREVAHEEKGLFLISMGVKDPEMVEVHASSREERNSWIQIIQDTINSLNRDEDEGIPSENEEEKKLLDTKARELKEQLQQKDQQILLLLEEKEMIFRDMTECSTPLPEDCSPTHSPRVLFRSNTEEALKGGPLMKSAINEVEILQSLVSGSLGGTLGQSISSPVEQEVMAAPISLPRRAETFGGFDCHQMNASKGGEKEEGDDGQDLRRTESDSGLKKGGNGNLVFMLKRNSEQVVQSIVHLHELLSMLQGVVLQQDSYIEDQKLVLTEKVLTRSASRPSSLIEQEKQRSLEKQRQDLANLQKQQAQHLEEKRRREREWEAREQELRDREAKLAEREETVRRRQQDLERDREELQQKKGTYQCDLERLRAAQKQLEREQEQLRRDTERLSQRQMDQNLCQVSNKHGRLMRIPSFLPNSDEFSSPSAPSVTKSGSLDSELSVSPKRNSISRTQKDKGPFHILGSASQTKVPEGQSQAPSSTSTSTRLFGLSKPKEKKEKKKKSKGSRTQPGDGPASEVPAEGEEIFC